MSYNQNPTGATPGASGNKGVGGVGGTTPPDLSQGISQQGMVPTPTQSTIGQQSSNFGQPNPVQPATPQNTSLNSTVLQNYNNQSAGWGVGPTPTATTQGFGNKGLGGVSGQQPAQSQTSPTTPVAPQPTSTIGQPIAQQQQPAQSQTSQQQQQASIPTTSPVVPTSTAQPPAAPPDELYLNPGNQAGVTPWFQGIEQQPVATYGAINQSQIPGNPTPDELDPYSFNVPVTAQAIGQPTPGTGASL